MHILNVFPKHGKAGVAVFLIQGQELLESGALGHPDNFGARGHYLLYLLVAETKHFVQQFGLRLLHRPGTGPGFDQSADFPLAYFGFGTGDAQSPGEQAGYSLQQPDRRRQDQADQPQRAGIGKGQGFRTAPSYGFGQGFAENQQQGSNHKGRGQHGQPFAKAVANQLQGNGGAQGRRRRIDQVIAQQHRGQ